MADRVHVSDRVSDVSGRSPVSPCPRVSPPTGEDTGRGHGWGSNSQLIVSSPTPGVNAALANAVRQVNAAFNRLGRSTQDKVEIRYDGLDAELDAAILSGDRDRAIAAIRSWRGHWLHQLSRAGGGR